MFRQEKIILILASIVYTITGNITYHPTMHSLSMMGWIGIVQLCYCIASWMKRGSQFLSPYVIFLLTLYLFSYGQSFLWALGLESERTLVGFYGISISEIFHAQVLTVIMLAFFHIGAIYCVARQRHNDNNIYCSSGRENLDRLQQIGWLLLLISAVPYVSETMHSMILSMTKGYGALYDGEENIGMANMSSFIAGYFIPSLICLFIAYKNNTFIRTVIVGVLLLNIVAILLTGGRSNAVILLAILIVLYNYLVKRFTKKWLLLGALGAFFFLQVLSFVGSVRTEGHRTANLDGMKVENNAAVDAIAEMGGTMFCLVKTMELVPSKEPYRYGRSYVYSFTTLIPNLGFWKIHPAKNESNLSDWLTDALGLGYGTGFSMCAEAYMNFGYLGFVVFFFWGWFLAGVLGNIENCVQTKDYARLAFLLILFWYFLKLPRNNFINLVRPVFFVAGPIYLYCSNKLKLR